VTERRWWLCPNDPPCPHAAVLHEVEEWGAPDVCSEEGCGCGRELEQQWRREGLG
jgi:hypothetical protein